MRQVNNDNRSIERGWSEERDWSAGIPACLSAKHEKAITASNHSRLTSLPRRAGKDACAPVALDATVALDAPVAFDAPVASHPWTGRFLFSLALACTLPAVGLAHDDNPHNFTDLMSAWTFDPLIVAILFGSAVLYVLGLRNLWRAGGRGSGVSEQESMAFAAGWFAMVIALVSPLHSWGEALFSAHMTQHEILMLVAAPMLILGRPFIASIWALPQAARVRIGAFITDRRIKSTWRFVSAPLAAWLIHALALWIWHVPVLFEATLRSDAIHTLQHASFFLSALLFWWAIVYGGRGVRSYGAGVLYLFTTSIHSGSLGVLLTLTTRVWYPSYSETAPTWGLTPLEDQQLGGLIMWIPAGIVYIFAALIMFAAWLRESDRGVGTRAIKGIEVRS